MSNCNQTETSMPELWLSSRLDPQEAAAFEEHLMTCATCQEAVQVARGLRRGLTLVAAEGLTTRPAPGRWGSPVRRYLALAAMVPLVVAATWVMWQEERADAKTQAAQVELARLEKVAGEAEAALGREQALRQELEVRSQELAARAEAQGKALDAATPANHLEPLAGLPTYLLAVLRDRSQAPDLVLKRHQLGQAFHLALDLPDPGYDQLRVEILGQDGSKLLDRKGLEPNELGALLLTLPADFLPLGESRVHLYGQGPGRPEQELGRFRIELQP